MDIQVGRYRLKSDGLAMWIEYGYDTKKSEKKDIDYRRVAGYSRTIPQLWKSFNEHQWKNSDAKDMGELLKDLSKLWKDMEMLNKAAVKEDFKMIRGKVKE